MGSSRRVRRLTFLAALAVLVAACGSDVKRYRVPSEAMAPTIPLGTKIKVDRGAYDDAAPKAGDIVVVHPSTAAASGDASRCGRPVRVDRLCDRPGPGPAKVSFVKRVVALPGDRVEIRAGKVVRNGRSAREPFAAPCPTESDGCNFRGAITVPDGHFYVLGDNRGASDDSRFWGPVPRAWFVGRVER